MDLIASVSRFSNDRIRKAHEECRKQSNRWASIKLDYADHLHRLCRIWV